MTRLLPRLAFSVGVSLTIPKPACYYTYMLHVVIPGVYYNLINVSFCCIIVLLFLNIIVK